MTIEEQLAYFLTSAGIKGFEREYRFAPPRRWRFDFAWPEIRLALEIEGGTWVRGRHNRPGGFAKDLEKYNTATLMGWRLLRFTPAQVTDGTALALVQLVVKRATPSASN
jgi:very-short-patch-repair endonuclease